MGCKFIVQTDHKNLIWMRRSKNAKVQRWCELLSMYDFEVQHIAGKDNVMADALSRALNIESVEEQLQHIQRCHGGFSGHNGINRTIQLLEEAGTTWKDMRKQVQEFIAQCGICQKVRLGQGSMDASLKTIAVAQPFEVIGIDNLGPFPIDDGFEYILVLQDQFSRFVELIPTRDASARSAAGAILQNMGRYGIPLEIRSDLGSQFTAKIVQDLLELIKVKARFTLAYNPKANGEVERANKEILRHARAFIYEGIAGINSWVSLLPFIQRIMNGTPCRSTGTTPARIMFGGKVDMSRAMFETKPGSTMMQGNLNGNLAGIGSKEEECEGAQRGKKLARKDQEVLAKAKIKNVEEYVQELADKYERIRVKACEVQQKAIEARLKKSPDNPTSFGVGSYVLLSYPERPPTKLHSAWRGPMIVTASKGNAYSVQDLVTLKIMEVDVTRLKAFKYEAGGMEDIQQAAKNLAAKDRQEFVVEKIIEHYHPGPNAKKKYALSKYEFFVRWAGYGPDEDSWIPWSEVKDLQALDAYLVMHPELHLK
jgi:hypothetical protein